MTFPALIGGTLIRDDLAPSIIFLILYGSLVPIAALRLLGKSSRTTLLIGTVIFSVERVVVFSLRVVQSRNQAKAGSHSLATYEQFTMGMGYLGICQDLVNLLRVLLVNATHPNSPKSYLNPCSDVDRPRERFWYRRLADFLHLAFISAIVPGVISGSNYSDGIDDPSTARRVMALRYASAGVALFLVATIGTITFIVSRKVPRVKARPARVLVILTVLLATVTVYRLGVMHYNTDSLLSRGSGSLSSPPAKALFYIFHMLPEWSACAILLGINARKLFASGPFGDWRSSDKETKWERKWRERKERKGGEVSDSTENTSMRSVV